MFFRTRLSANSPVHATVIRAFTTAIFAVGLGIFLFASTASAQNPFLQRSGDRKIGRISFLGNEVTQDYILYRTLGLKEGDSYDALEVSDAWERLEQLNFVAYVDIQQSRSAEVVDLVIQIEEDQRVQVAPRAEYERRHDGVIVGLDARMLNVRGRAETVQLSTSWWAKHGYYGGWSNPHILGNARLGLAVGAYWERYDFRFESFRLREAGAWIGVSRPAGQHGQVGITYQYRDFGFDESDVFSGSGADPRLDLNASFDTRNIQYYPSAGVHAEGQVSVGGLGQGDEAGYTFFEAQLATFYRLPFVEILAARVWYRGADVTLPLYERTYLGGPSNLRGLDFGSIEGDQSYLATLEIRRPIFILPLRDGRTVGLGVHAFHDWGKSFEANDPFSSVPVRWSRGLGAHVNLNTKSFRFEWARTDDGDNVFVFEDTLTF